MEPKSMLRHAGIAGALVASLSTTGCRLGNQVVSAPDPTSMSGFYKTEVASMSICSKLSSQEWRCANANTSMIPGVIQNIMTNPVYMSANTTKAKAYLVPNTLDTSNYFEMNLTTTGSLSAPTSVSESKPLWNDDACQTQVELSKEGKVRSTAQTTQGNFKVSGTVDFAIAVVNALSGDCTQTLAELRSCYLDSTKCPGSTAQEQTETQKSVRDYYAPYVNQGVLSVDEITQVEALGWEASYH
jgi:hypothetical protein